MNKIPCEVIRDLFPSYIDELTSKVTNDIIEEHNKNCPECAKILESMKEPHIEANTIENEKKEIDLFVDYYDINKFNELESNHNLGVSLVMLNSDDRVFTSISSLKGYKVYCKDGSRIAASLKASGLDVGTYKNKRELTSLLNKSELVVMDSMEYMLYARENKNVSERFREELSTTYNYKTNADTMFNRLFTYFVTAIDKNEVLFVGLSDYYKKSDSASIIKSVVKYALIIIIIVCLVAYLMHKFGRRINISKKISKNEKMKFIDVSCFILFYIVTFTFQFEMISFSI